MAGYLTPAEIEGLLADTLSAEDKARADAHLAACETCRQEFERGRADNALLGMILRVYEPAWESSSFRSCKPAAT